MKRARIHLINNKEIDVEVLNPDLAVWINDVILRGIITDDAYIPHHSISHIWFEEVEDTNLAEFGVAEHV